MTVDATTKTDGTERVPMGSPEYWEGYAFLVHEAELLDGDELEAWLGLMAEEVDYRVPVQATRMRGQEVASTDSYLLHDDAASLRMRVTRLVSSEFTWANNPQPRTRRFVSNVRVSILDEGRLGVSSYLLVVRNRRDDPDHDLISAEREDVLVRTGEGLRLTSRLVTVDQSCLGVPNLSLFL